MAGAVDIREDRSRPRATPHITTPRESATALVLGADVDLVSALARAGIRCAVFAAAGEPLHHSRAVADRVDRVDPWKEPEEAVERIRAFALRQPTPPVLFPQTDGDLLAISRHRRRLEGVCRFLIPDRDTVEELLDKDRFRDLAARLDLPVPPSRRLRPADEPIPTELGLRLPAIVKPLVKDYARWDTVETSAKALHVGSLDDLRALWPTLAEQGLEVLVQEQIPGPESRIESYHALLAEDGVVIAEFTGRKIRTFPETFGHTTALEITSQDDVRDLGRVVVRRIGLAGPVKVDFKRAPDGTLHLLELNPRFNLWHGPAAVAGVNVPALLHARLTGSAPPRIEPVRAGVTWCVPLDDARTARQHGVSPVEWLRFVARCDVRSGLSRRDWRPFVRGIAYPYVAERARRMLAR